MGENILCIIHAGKGSKRTPHNNILQLGGKPLILHSIEHAIQSKLVNKIVVCTGDSEISRISKECGVGVIKWASEIYSAHATLELEIKHVIEQVEGSGFSPALIVSLQCTSPIRSSDDIDRAIETLYKDNADSLLSVCRNDRFLWRVVSGNMQCMNYNNPENDHDNDHPVEYRENGSLYIFKPEVVHKYSKRLGGKISVYEMDYWSSFQVDSPDHLELCEWIFEKKKKAIDLSSLPETPKLIVSDFDGVMTNNKVVTDHEGVESVICDRADGLGISIIKKMGIHFIVLSTERNPVVNARCRKLSIPFIQGCDDKLTALKQIANEQNMSLSDIIYVGNDINDLDCIKNVGCSVAVADSNPNVLRFATIILKSKGGEGAIRELSELIIDKIKLV